MEVSRRLSWIHNTPGSPYTTISRVYQFSQALCSEGRFHSNFIFILEKPLQQILSSRPLVPNYKRNKLIHAHRYFYAIYQQRRWLVLSIQGWLSPRVYRQFPGKGVRLSQSNVQSLLYQTERGLCQEKEDCNANSHYFSEQLLPVAVVLRLMHGLLQLSLHTFRDGFVYRNVKK